MAKTFPALYLHRAYIVLARKPRLGNQEVDLHSLAPVIGAASGVEVQPSSGGNQHLRDYVLHEHSLVNREIAHEYSPVNLLRRKLVLVKRPSAASPDSATALEAKSEGTATPTKKAVSLHIFIVVPHFWSISLSNYHARRNPPSTAPMMPRM